MFDAHGPCIISHDHRLHRGSLLRRLTPQRLRIQNSDCRWLNHQHIIGRGPENRIHVRNVWFCMCSEHSEQLGSSLSSGKLQTLGASDWWGVQCLAMFCLERFINKQETRVDEYTPYWSVKRLSDDLTLRVWFYLMMITLLSWLMELLWRI